jgi:hypothetical protein
MSERPGSVTIVALLLFLLALFDILLALVAFQFIGGMFSIFSGLASSSGNDQGAGALAAFGSIFGGLLAGILVIRAIICLVIGFLVLKGNRIGRWAAVGVGTMELFSFHFRFPLGAIIGIIFLYVLLGDQKSKDFFAK